MADNEQDEITLDPKDVAAELGAIDSTAVPSVDRSDGRPGMEEQLAGAEIAGPLVATRPPVNERLRTPPPRPAVTMDPEALAALDDLQVAEPTPPETMEVRPSSREVLADADRVIHGDRAAAYGPAEDSFGRIAALWSVHLGQPIDAYDVALMMVLMKVSRAKTDLSPDTFVDIAGYAALAPRCAVASDRHL